MRASTRRLLALIVPALTACSTFSSFDPEPIEQVPFLERALTETRSGLTVTTAVPTRAEADRIFGVDLAEHRIQPVWLDIHNQSEVPYSLLLTGTDPSYYSAHEAAYRSHLRFRPGTNRRIDAHFDRLQMDGVLMPGERSAGFVFTSWKLGTKEVRARLFGPGRLEEFEFFAFVPGFKPDYHEADWETLFGRDFTDHETEAALRAALRELPCCTTRQSGSGRGDPINLVIIASPASLGAALMRSGWDETEKLDIGSAWRTFKAFFGGEYKYSPMSALYFDGRSQDAGFQKARETIHQRNHLRLWLSDMTFQGRHVWLGTISRDIGVYFTWRTWNLTTHAIDPYVDEARGSLIEDFASAQSLVRFGFVGGVGAATPDDPHRNLMNAPWWTDGLRVVMDLSEARTPIERVDFFYWDWPASPDQAERLNELLRRSREAARSEWDDGRSDGKHQPDGAEPDDGPIRPDDFAR
jgi:hypothetical protein